MARVIIQQSSQIKAVIKESYKPDITFRVAGEAKIRVNFAFSQMPVECILMELHLLVNSTTHIVPLLWLGMHYMGDMEYAEIAEVMGGRTAGQIEGAVEDMLDDAVYRMPQYLANKCLNIYDTFLAAPKVYKIKPPPPPPLSVKPGVTGLLAKVFEKIH